MTLNEQPECPVCGHRSRHTHTNVRRCDECAGPCVTEEGWRSLGSAAMRDPWTVTARAAARAAGYATADVLRIRHDLAALADLEAAAGETFAGAALRVAVRAAELRRTVWRGVARSPGQVLLPPVAVVLIWASRRRG